MAVVVDIVGVDATIAGLYGVIPTPRYHEASVSVGYTQAYAVYVHEDMEAHHPVGQAKYLEEPARRGADLYGRIMTQAFAKGATLEQSLLVGGLRLQRDSQVLCPVDTGALKASAFTSIDPVPARAFSGA